MCGINGLVTISRETLVNEEAIYRMNEAIKHRWPDDSGVCIKACRDGFLAFWQNRLSIVDLTPAWHQPMSYLKKSWASSEVHQVDGFNPELLIVFNGEIYNFPEIRSELSEKWYRFSTQTDTETILAAYLEWGNSCTERFNGMWAFAIYDEKKNEIFCSRDRLGKKPFYYYFDGKTFAFSSELKGLLKLEKLSFNSYENVDQEALEFFFSLGFIPAPWSIFKNIKKLEARHNLRICLWEDSEDMRLVRECYYQIPKYSPIHNRDELISEWKKILETATKIRMFRSDVPVWAFLSWWLDSSAVVWEMTKWITPENLHTFSVGFEGKYDETVFIEEVRKVFNTFHHHEYFRHADFRTLIDEVWRTFDEPFGDYSNFPTYFVSSMAKRYVSVALSWDGWDEIFWWYSLHRTSAQMEILYGLPLYLKKLFLNISRAFKFHSIWRKAVIAFETSISPKEEFIWRIRWKWAVTETVKKWMQEKFTELMAINDQDFVESVIDFDLYYWTLSDNYLVKTDRASMAHALEIRSPLLDVNFIEFSRKIPSKWKADIWKTKILMRDIIKNLVPDNIRNRWKQGFVPPIEDWVRPNSIKDAMYETWKKNYLNKKI